ncbi:MAG: permease [Candidatus Omnitrophica bacterium]|nr:permease [Candidatus Omnitrophota bacterium]
MNTYSLAKVIDIFKCCIFTWGALTTILPAFIIAGAVAAFVPTSTMTRYLGPGTKRYISYPVASIAGIVLPACSCNIVPLFASILDRGAGIGPAFTFLYAGPAINLISAIITFKVIGSLVGIWRLIGVFVISIVLGLVMETIFRAKIKPQEIKPLVDTEKTQAWRLIMLFILLFAILIIGSLLTSPTSADVINPAGVRLKITLFILCLSLLLWLVLVKFKKSELLDWSKQTFKLAKMIVPLFIISILLVGFIARYVDVRWINHLLTAQKDIHGYRLFFPTLSTTFFATIFGELMYFPILSEIVFTKAFLKLGMDIGPALAILLAGPGTSLPGFLLVSRFVGWKKVSVYFVTSVILEVIFATTVAMWIGDYICACLVIK